MSQVLRSGQRRSFGGDICLVDVSLHILNSTPGLTNLAHSTVNNKVSSVDEAALVAGEEDDSVGLLDGLTETAGREVNLATETLGLVIAQPVLKKGGAIGVSNDQARVLEQGRTSKEQGRGR